MRYGFNRRGVVFKLRLPHFLVTSILFHLLKFFVEDFEPKLKKTILGFVKSYAPQKNIKLPIGIQQSRMTHNLKGVDLCGLSSRRDR